MGKGGFTLVELMVVVGLFSLLFSALVTLLTNSDMYYHRGQDLVSSHFEARKLLDTLAMDLRLTSPNWVINGTSYPLAVSSNFTRIDFYVPEFDASNNISDLQKVTYKLDPADNTSLLMKVGTDPQKVVSSSVTYVNFGAGCSGCASYTCSSPASDCPVVRIQVRTQSSNDTAEFSLETKVALRNQNSTLVNSTDVDAPSGGEF